MIDRERRFRIVHLLMGINGAGFVLIGTLMGGASELGYVPWYGIAGLAVMFLGIVVPFYREFLSLRQGFDEVERETLKTIRRDRQREIGHQSVLDAGSRPQPFTRVRSQPLVVITITAVAWGLVIFEGVRWLS